MPLTRGPACATNRLYLRIARRPVDASADGLTYNSYPAIERPLRMRKLIEQFLKFGVVGVIAFVIDYGVLMLLSQGLGWDPVVSAAISFLVSLVFNYLASMKYVFARRDDMSRRREFVTFCALSAVGLGINELIIAGGTALLGTSALAVTGSKIVATAVVMVWNFVSRKKWLEAKAPEVD